VGGVRDRTCSSFCYEIEPRQARQNPICADNSTPFQELRTMQLVRHAQGRSGKGYVSKGGKLRTGYTPRHKTDGRHHTWLLVIIGKLANAPDTS